MLRRPLTEAAATASHRRGRIDPNPHQLDAALFALRRLPEGGCILADEVGLGKTIEAGLVIAQLLAQGAQRILLIVPTSLVPQWQSELLELFGLASQAGIGELDGAASPGIFVVSRDWAGGERGAELLGKARPFDLCVIDEAHEVFAGIHQRYDAQGEYRAIGRQAQMAHRVRQSIASTTPMLLLTATPIQNSLVELWGLVQYVEPTGTLLGDLPTFRQIFCDGDDRLLVPDQAPLLRDRLSRVLKRTLRRQAQEFLARPFVARRTKLIEYRMTADEHRLYADVTKYLLEPQLCAFPSRTRRLLLLGFHRRMASSTRALAVSLERVQARLEGQLAALGRGMQSDGLGDIAEMPAEEEATWEEDAAALGESPARVTEQSVLVGSGEPLPEVETARRGRLMAELERVRSLARSARQLPHDSKAEALLEMVAFVRERGTVSGGTGKLVVFTESRVTQLYIDELLRERGGLSESDITLLSGDNDNPRAHAALALLESSGTEGRASGGKEARLRAALVQRFREPEGASVFIATEAGAKGLNLQFCDTVVNYDLPWNPQRIEQRIGRCHRYGQQRDVTVINFLAGDNEAQRLTFDILSRKLDLFGTVLDASDAVLHEPSTEATEVLAGFLGGAFETSLNRIYEKARSLAEIEAELVLLGEEMAERRQRFETEMARTAGVIDAELHETVRERFRRLRDAQPQQLAAIDAQMESVVRAFLEAIGVPYRIELPVGEPSGQRRIQVAPSQALPEPWQAGGALSLCGAGRADGIEPLHPSHPLVQAAVREAREATTGKQSVRVQTEGSALRRYAGFHGCLRVEKVAFEGFCPFEELLVVASLDPGTTLTPDEALGMLGLPMEAMAEAPGSSACRAAVRDGLEEALFLSQHRAAEAEQAHFDALLIQLDRFIQDRVLVLKRRRLSLQRSLSVAADRLAAAVGASQRTSIEQELSRLATELQAVELELSRLDERLDPVYERWMRDAQHRRYAPPKRQAVLEVEFELW